MKYAEDGVNPVKRRDRTSQFKGVCWSTGREKWQAECRGKCLGYHNTEEGAVQAYNTYRDTGAVPVKRRDGLTSQYKAGAYTRPLFGST